MNESSFWAVDLLETWAPDLSDALAEAAGPDLSDALAEAAGPDLSEALAEAASAETSLIPNDYWALVWKVLPTGLSFLAACLSRIAY